MVGVEYIFFVSILLFLFSSPLNACSSSSLYKIIVIVLSLNSSPDSSFPDVGSPLETP